MSEFFYTSKTMFKELNNIMKDPPYGISVTLPYFDDPTIWNISMKGPIDTIYEYNTYKLELIHRDKFKPPSVKFIEHIPMHPNIGVDGSICLDILTDKKYSPALIGTSILISIQSLLSDPNPYECIRPELGKLLIEDPETYNIIISLHCKGDDLLFNETINNKVTISNQYQSQV